MANLALQQDGRRKKGFDKNGHRHCKGCAVWRPLNKFQVYGVSKKTGNNLRRKVCMSCRARSNNNLERRNVFYEKSRVRRINLKSKLVKLLGGQCSSCRNFFPACVYDFHHKDPTIKKNHISRLIPIESKEEELYKEIKKCYLLCANCHRILHYGGDASSQISQ